jgi:hypothetical protein
MIIMAYTELGDVNATDLTDLVVYTAEISPSFWPFVLFGFWLIGTMGSYFSQKRLTGTGDFFGSATVGCFTTTVVASILFFITDALPLFYLIIIMTLTLIITLIFFNSREKL